MKLFKSFTDEAPNKVFLSMILGVIAGLSYALFIPVVINSIPISSDAPSFLSENKDLLLGVEINNYKFAIIFFVLCIFILLTRSISQIILVRVAMDVTKTLRLKIYKQILKAPISDLEKIGPSKLLATVTTDVTRIVQGAKIIPDILISTVTVFGLLSFLVYLNFDVFWFVVGSIIFGVISYQIPIYIGRKYFRRGREWVDQLHESIRGLIYGAKELKINKKKRDAYFEEILLSTEKAIAENDKKGDTIITAANNYGDLISFFVIGFIAYVFINYNSISGNELIGVIMVLLYITAPVGLILNAMPEIALANVSLNKVNKLFDQISGENIAENIYPLPSWNYIEFRDILYSYNDLENEFHLGPINLKVYKGEITFIVGGNGSGKSTLCKLISLHYLPLSGQIYFGELPVNKLSINSCRQNISAIFTDFYLFDRLMDGLREDSNTIENYLKELKLENKVNINKGKFSTVKLSDGQKKRLALLVTFLEDKDVYIFDEWAADQDPIFKEVFYREILPGLKSKGKLVIVISHDDRYFGLADQTIFMEEGRVTKKIKKKTSDIVKKSNTGLDVEVFN